MPLSPTELEALFFQEVPESVLLDTARCLTSAYADASKYIRDNFPGEEAHDLYPIERRAMFERNWRSRLSRYKFLEISADRNAGGNCFHNLVRCGRVVLTASAVERPSEPAREAIFRETLARSAQLTLPGAPEMDTDDGLLYAMLVHGPLGAGILRSPAFLHVGFPDPDCKFFVAQIDLVRRFPILQADFSIKPADIERRKPRLRRERKEGAG